MAHRYSHIKPQEIPICEWSISSSSEEDGNEEKVRDNNIQSNSSGRIENGNQIFGLSENEIEGELPPLLTFDSDTSTIDEADDSLLKVSILNDMTRSNMIIIDEQVVAYHSGAEDLFSDDDSLETSLVKTANSISIKNSSSSATIDANMQNQDLKNEKSTTEGTIELTYDLPPNRKNEVPHSYGQLPQFNPYPIHFNDEPLSTPVSTIEIEKILPRCISDDSFDYDVELVDEGPSAMSNVPINNVIISQIEKQEETHDLFTLLSRPNEVSMLTYNQSVNGIITFRRILNIPRPIKAHSFHLRVFFTDENGKIRGNYLLIPMETSKSTEGKYKPGEYSQILVHFPVCSPLLLHIDFHSQSNRIARTVLHVIDGRLISAGNHVLQFSQNPTQNCSITKQVSGLFVRNRIPSLELEFAPTSKKDDERLKSLPMFSIIILQSIDPIINLRSLLVSNISRFQSQQLSLFSSVLLHKKTLDKFKSVFKESTSPNNYDRFVKSMFQILMDEKSFLPFSTKEIILLPKEKPI